MTKTRNFFSLERRTQTHRSLFRMMRLILTITLSLTLSIAVLQTTTIFAMENQSQAPSTVQFAEDVILVQFDRDLPEQSKAVIRSSNSLILDKKLNTTGLERMLVKGNRPVHSVINQLKGMKGIVFAEPDYKLEAGPINVSLVTPTDDTYFSLLWGLNNTGQSINGVIGDGQTDTDAPEAWATTPGSNTIIVAVIDEAVDQTHPDLVGVVVDSQKFNTGSTAYEHGTHVAGTIAANDNAIGVVGLAPQVKIMSLSFLGPNGGSTSNAILAINYAKDHGAHIINASWGGGGYSQALKDAIEAFGRPFVAAAGNDGVNTDSAPHYPSAYTSSNIISVAALSNTGQLASFSNYGAVSVDIGAPGVDIASTYPGGYAYMSGTSMAAPHVSGVLALMKSYKPDATTTELISALYSSARPVPSLVDKTQTGSMADADHGLLALGSGPVDPVPENPLLLVSSSPSNNQTNVKRTANIILTFDRVYTVWDTAKIQLKDGNGNPVSFVATGLGSTKLTINPAPTLNSLAKYTLTLAPGAVQATSAPESALTPSPLTITFTTGRK